MSVIYAYKSRGIQKDLTVRNAAGTAIVVTANDKLRVVIGREGRLGVNFADAELVITTDAATANGSSITKGTAASPANRVRFDASDLAFEPGTYTLFLDFFDNADAQEWKNVDRQVFILEATE